MPGKRAYAGGRELPARAAVGVERGANPNGGCGRRGANGVRAGNSTTLGGHGALIVH